MCSVEDFNNRILEIWEKAHKADFKDSKKIKKDGKIQVENMPMLSPWFLPDNLKQENCKLLIIGLNPSYSYNNWKNILSKINTTEYDFKKIKQLKSAIKKEGSEHDRLIDDFFTYYPENSNKEELLKLDEKASHKSDCLDYFKKMHELASYLYAENGSESMVHLDIYFYRKTSQDDIKNFENTHSDFFKNQRDLTKKIIIWLNPEIILVSNAYAGDIFRDMFASPKNSFFCAFPIDESIGTHIVPINHKKIPVFFSGMLSGQRALDLGSYERLKWQMKAVIEGKKME